VTAAIGAGVMSGCGAALTMLRSGGNGKYLLLIYLFYEIKAE